MDTFYNDFITYDDPSFDPKSSSMFENDFSVSPSFSDDHSDSTGILPNFMPKTVQNFLDVEEYASPNGPQMLSSQILNQPAQNFQVAQKNNFPIECTDSVEHFELYDATDDNGSKLASRSKRIQKREKAKERIKSKTSDSPLNVCAQNIDPSFLPDGYDDPDADDKTKKKIVQMIRNRVSAQNSRDRKKMYLQQLESAQELLTNEKDALIRDKNNLLKRINEIEANYARLLKENEELKRNSLCKRCGANFGNPSNQGASVRPAPGLFPSRAHAGQGSFFGIGLSFALMMCLFVVMNTGPSSKGGMKGNKSTMMSALSRLVTPPIVEYYAQAEQTSIAEPLNIEEIKEQIFAACNEEAPVVEEDQKPKAAIEALYEKIYETYEATNDMINSLTVTQEKMEEELPVEPLGTSVQNGNNSSLFCPNNFEFYKKVPSSLVQQEETHLNDLEKTTTLDLAHTNYVQLLVPKSSIGKAGFVPKVEGADCEISHGPMIDENQDLVVVWAKIITIGGLSLSL